MVVIVFLFSYSSISVMRTTDLLTVQLHCGSLWLGNNITLSRQTHCTQFWISRLANHCTHFEYSRLHNIQVYLTSMKSSVPVVANSSSFISSIYKTCVANSYKKIALVLNVAALASGSSHISMLTKIKQLPVHSICFLRWHYATA